MEWISINSVVESCLQWDHTVDQRSQVEVKSISKTKEPAQLNSFVLFCDFPSVFLMFSTSNHIPNLVLHITREACSPVKEIIFDVNENTRISISISTI